MYKFILTLFIFAVTTAHAAAPKTATASIPSNTATVVTSVALGDAYNYAREIDGVKFTVSGKTETNVVIVATLGQNMSGFTNTIVTQSLSSNITEFVFPRNFIATNCVERFNVSGATLSCTFVWATNTALSTTLTNAASVEAMIFTK